MPLGMFRRGWLSALVFALVSLFALSADAAQPVANGNLTGTVTDGSGSTTVPGITVTLSRGGTSVATVVSDDQGTFTFSGVEPGAYEVQASTGDNTSLARTSVTITAGQQATVALKLGLSENVDVVATPAAVAPSSAQTLDADLINKAPVADDIRALLPLLPGVVRGADGRVQMKGGQPTQGGYQVSGASVTDPSTNDFAFALPSEAVESVDVLPNPFAAEYGRFTTGVTEMRTRRGDEKWRVTPNSVVPRLTLRRDGAWDMALRSFTPRVAVGGPLVKDRLFLAQSAQFRLVKTPLTGLPNEPTINLRSFDSYTRVDTAAAASQQATAALAIFPRRLEHAGLNTFNPAEVTPNATQNGFNLGFVHRWVQTSALVESMVNVKRYDVGVKSNGTSPMTLSPLVNSGSFFNDQQRDTLSIQASSSVSRAVSILGEHLFKVGVDVMQSHYEGTNVNRPVHIRRLDGTLARTIQVATPTTQDVDGTDVAVFVQDRWRLASAFTLEGGLRADRDGVTRKFGIGPRLGFSLTPGGTTTVIRGGGGVFYQRTPLNVGAFNSYGTRRVTTFAADGVTETAAAVMLTPIARDLQLPSSVVWNLGFDHHLTPALTVRVNHLRRLGSHETIVDPQMTPGSGTLVLSSNGRSRYWEQETTVRYQSAPRYDLTFSYVWSRTRADVNSYDMYFGNARVPIIQPNAYTIAGTDVPHRLVIWGTVALSDAWEVLPLFEVRSGFPYSAVNALQDIVGTRNGAGRFPVLASLDLAVQRRLKVMNRNIRVGIRAYNLLNRPAYRDVQANVSAPTYGTFSNPVERSFGATLWIER